MAPGKRSHDDYSVGWICALPKEQTAATAMLDERHPDLPKPTNDTNTYTLGSISSHNVVIACLPKGQYGNNSAANVATLMISAFPCIKIGLLVGIGGGVPMQVRLGDVVVSTPSGQYPGVVQWDLGKATEGGKFERTGALSNPPGSLLTALSKLETEHELTGSKIPSFLTELERKYPRLAKKYLKSDSLQDLLFRADYAHVHEPFMNTQGATGGVIEPSLDENEESDDECEESCPFCDRTMILKRKRRLSMKIHHGLIASGNKVIKDGVLRDEVNRSLGGDVLCFEMEAAGLMNNFPCLVIRGICDYCDSHKNKAWQEHAAAVAAAFAKEVLGCIQHTDIKNERLISDAMNEVKEKIELVHEVAIKTKNHLDTLIDDNALKKQTETLTWLSPLEFPSLQYEYIRKCAPNTGQEFVRSDEVQNWMSTRNQTLFCQGVPGAGKTFQMAILVKHLMEKIRRDDTVGVAYLYYNFKRQNDQKAEQMLANLIKQLAQMSKPFPEPVHQLRERHGPTKTRPLIGELCDTLTVVIQSFSRVYILIDALDEGDDSERTNFLGQMFAVQEKTGFNLFATSRTINTIAATFDGSLSRNISPTRHDVFQFLNSRMSELPLFVADDITLQNEIKASVESAIGGMFLLAQLYINSLAGRRSPASLKVALKDIRQASSSSDKSKILDEAYDKSMERIQHLKGDLSRDGLLILSWIVKARRQMRLAELQEALAVEVGSSELNTDNIPTIEHITQACASLVTVEGDMIELVHYTAQEYFERPGNEWMQEAHANITNICIAYLSFPAFRNEPCLSRECLDRRIEKSLLYSYSTEHWGYHANEALNQGLDISDVVEFLGYGLTEGSWYQDLLYGHSYRNCEHEFIPAQLTMLHIAAALGIHAVVEKLLAQGHRPDAQDSLLQTPLWWAAWAGHTQVVQLLLKAYTDRISDVEYSSKPLLIADRQGHKAVVELLLEISDIESKGAYGWTPLCTAIRDRHQVIVEVLFEKGANIETRDYTRRTPLALAAKWGNETAVKWLLGKGANIEAKDINNETPLALASRTKQESIAKILIEKGANIETQGHKNQTPLMLAIKEEHESLVRYFITKGANTGASDSNNQTPLSIAIRKKSKIIIELLIQNGININTIMPNNYTPLTLAIDKEDGDNIAWLIEKGADLDMKDGHVMTPLITAIKKGSQDIIDFLIKKGAGLEVKGSERGFTPLIFATFQRRHDIVELLIRKGANLGAVDNSGHNALFSASVFGYLHIAQSLVKEGAKLGARDLSINTALSAAVVWGRAEIIRFLLDNNSNIDTKDAGGRTPLYYAVTYGISAFFNALLPKVSSLGTTNILLGISAPAKILQMLLTSNPNLEVEYRLTVEYTTGSKTSMLPVLHHAVINGNIWAMELLLQSKAKTNKRGPAGETLMHFAVIAESLAMLQLNTMLPDGQIPLSYAVDEDQSYFKLFRNYGKVDANAKNNYGSMPIFQAFKPKEVSIMGILLDSGKVDVNAKDDEGRTPLQFAIEHKNDSTIRTLLSYGEVDVNAEDSKRRSPLLYAIELGEVSIVQMLLDCGRVNVNARDIKGRSPLLYATELNAISIIKALLSCENVDADAEDNNKRTAFHNAMRCRNTAITELLLHSGKVDANAEDGEGLTPILYAIETTDLSLLQLLLGSGQVNANAADNTGRTPLFYAIEKRERDISHTMFKTQDLYERVGYREGCAFSPQKWSLDAELLHLLLKSEKINPNTTDKGGYTTLHQIKQGIHGNDTIVYLITHETLLFLISDNSNASLLQAIKKKEDYIITELLQFEKIDANGADKDGYTPLLHAIKEGGKSITALLKSEKVDANAASKEGYTPLIQAIKKKDIHITRALLDSKKVDINVADREGYTPLHLAIKEGEGPIITELLKSEKIDANAADRNGYTPLTYAIKEGNKSTIQALLDSGKVDANIADKNDCIPLTYAVKEGDISIVQALLDYGKIDANAADKNGCTPLTYVIKKGDISIIQALLDSGKIDANIKDNEGRTPLSYAMEVGDKSIVKALLKFDTVEVDVKDGKGRTPLSYAASCDVARILTRAHKVDVDSKDKLGKTPIWHATQAGNQELVDLLRRRGAKDGSERKKKGRSARRKASIYGPL